MNATTGRDGITFGQNVSFFGRSGIRNIKGLRIAFISGIDSDILGSEIRSSDPRTEYLGNYFV